jgi:hypothetical protein
MTSKLKDIAFYTFFGFSILVILGYFFLLYKQVTNSTVGQLAPDDFVWLGVVIIGFIAADFLIVRRFIRRARKNNPQR